MSPRWRPSPVANAAVGTGAVSVCPAPKIPLGGTPTRTMEGAAADLDVPHAAGIPLGVEMTATAELPDILRPFPASSTARDSRQIDRWPYLVAIRSRLRRQW